MYPLTRYYDIPGYGRLFNKEHALTEIKPYSILGIPTEAEDDAKEGPTKVRGNHTRNFLKA